MRLRARKPPVMTSSKKEEEDDEGFFDRVSVIKEKKKRYLLSLSVWSTCLGKFGNIWKIHLAEYGPRQG